MAQRKFLLHSFIPSTKVFKTSASLSGFMLLAPLSTQAQITPDQTLGAEVSKIDRNVTVRGALGDRINGGAIRGVNNFHSFSDFNVLNDQRVYFSNQSGVENIITRVTGANGSNIHGTLGVDGKANLFLINPNGIVFGPNAQLDVAGSFWAGTSDRVLFSNGESFGTNSSSVPALVEVNIPIGLQMGKNALAMVRNEAKLATGKELGLQGSAVVSSGSLKADRVQVAATVGNAEVSQVTARSATIEAKQNIVLNSSQLKTTEDLTLKAEGTLQARDTVAKPLAVAAGRDLQVQGNQKIDILALNHPTPAFQAGGDLKLISDGIISGDSHFISGGSFSILNLNGQPGNLLSLNDPIIRSNKDVTFGAYSGASLKVEARGSIKATGNITVNAPDATATGDPDSAILTAQPALILRSGVASIATSTGITVAFVESPITTPGDITVENIVVGTATAPGRVILESRNNGTIKLGDVLDTKQGQTDLNAQTIDIKASGVTVNGTVNFNGGTVQGGPINGGAGNEIFNFNGGSIANGLTIDAKDGTNIFNLKGTTFGTGVDLKGGAGSDTVTVDGANNLFAVSGAKSGSVRGANISAIDIYTGSGTDTVQGMASNDTFQITGNRSLTSSGIAFSGTQNIDGKDGSDVYQLNNGVPSSAIAINDTGTGVGDIDRLDYSAYTTDPNVNLAAIGAVGIEEVRGRNTGASTITASNQPNDWTLNSSGSGTINTLKFFNFNQLVGGNLADTFTLNPTTNGFNSIDGRGGSNAILNPLFSRTIDLVDNKKGIVAGINFQNIDIFTGSGFDRLNGNINDETFEIIGSQAVTARNIAFTGIQTVDGRSGNDTYKLSNGVLPNAIAIDDTGAGGGDVLDYSAYTTDPNVNLGAIGAVGVEEVRGRATGASTIAASNQPNDWILNGGRSGTINTLRFTNFNRLIGGDLGDTFTILSGASGFNLIDGGLGVNAIANPTANQTIGITGLNQGLFNTIAFQNIATFQGSGTDTLLGTAGDDIFFASAANSFILNGVNIIGANGVDGSMGVDTVVNTAGAQTVSIIGDNQISTLGKTFRAIENFTGSGGDTIDGTGGEDTFNITAANTVRAASINFTGVQTVDGKNGDDTFALDGGYLTGSIKGGGGTNTLLGQQDISSIPPDDNDEFVLTGTSQGIVKNSKTMVIPGFGLLSFPTTTNFEQIQKIDGRSGVDTLTGTTETETFSLGSLSVPGIQVTNVEALNGGGGDDILLGDSNDNIFNITGPNSGTVGSLIFSNMPNLQGLGGNDRFLFSTGANIKGNVSGGQGQETFQINPGAAITGSLSGDDDDDIFEMNGGTIASQIDGGNGLDRILGSNSDDIFQLTGPKAGTVNGAIFTNIETADARLGNDTLKGTSGVDNFLITDAFVATGAGFQAKNFETIDGLDGDNLFTIQSGNLTTLLGGTGLDTVNLEGGTVTTVNLGDGSDLFVLKPSSGIATTVNLGNGDDVVRVEGNSSISGTLDGGAGSLTILGKENLQGLPTAANSISGTGLLKLGAIDPNARIVINNGTADLNAVVITPTNLQAIKSGFTQVLLEGSTIGIQSNTNTNGNAFKLSATSGNIDAQNGQFNTNDGNLDLSATEVKLNNSTLSTTTGNLTIAAPTLALNSSTLSTTTGNLTLNTPTQTLEAASKITSSSGPIAITSTTQTLNNGSAIATTSGPITINTTTQTLNSSSTIANNSGPIAITAQTQTLNGASTITSTSGNIGITAQDITLKEASKITSTSGNIGITAQDITLKEASKITTSGNIDITAPTINLTGNSPATTGTPTSQLSQPRADRAEIATRSPSPGAASGNLTLNTTNLTLDNAALIAETGRGAPNGNVRINFPGTTQSPTLTGKLELKNSSLILAQGDRRSNGDVLFTGGATVRVDPARSPLGKDGSDIITNANPDRPGGTILFETKDNPGRTFAPSAQSFSNAGFRVRKAQVGNGTNDLSSNEAIDLPPPLTQQTDKVSTEFTDPNKLVSAECQPNNRQADRRSQFSIAGKGGLPSNPTAVLGAESSQDDWVTLPVPKAPPKSIAQAPTKLKPPTTKPAQCLQSWQNSQNVNPQNK
jgi:filamentous hemagglutinin family protein